MLFVFSCSQDNEGSNGVGDNGTPTKRTLTIAKPKNGTVTSDVGDINCGADGGDTCKADLDNGTKVTLTAAPDANYGLGDWGGDDCSGPGVECNVDHDYR